MVSEPTYYNISGVWGPKTLLFWVLGPLGFYLQMSSVASYAQVTIQSIGIHRRQRAKDSKSSLDHSLACIVCTTRKNLDTPIFSDL